MEKRNYKYADYKQSLVDAHDPDPNDGWLPFPGQTSLTAGVKGTYRSRIKNGDFFGPGFTAKVRNGHLYAKYVGTNN